jgi:hypothetical protein
MKELEGLNKKFDALKRELDHAIDNDRLTSRTKIRKQLSDEANLDDFKIHCLKMQEALSGLLQLNENEDGRYAEFAKLRDQLLLNRELIQSHYEKDFDHAIYVLSRVTERMMALKMLQRVGDNEEHRDVEFGSKPIGSETFYLRYWQSIPRIIMGAQDANDQYHDYFFTDNLRAFIFIQKCLPHLRQSLPPDYTEIKIYIDTIVFYLQKIVDEFEVK